MQERTSREDTSHKTVCRSNKTGDPSYITPWLASADRVFSQAIDLQTLGEIAFGLAQSLMKQSRHSGCAIHAKTT
jgi:hypothetical protein